MEFDQLCFYDIEIETDWWNPEIEIQEFIVFILIIAYKSNHEFEKDNYLLHINVILETNKQLMITK